LYCDLRAAAGINSLLLLTFCLRLSNLGQNRKWNSFSAGSSNLVRNHRISGKFRMIQSFFEPTQPLFLKRLQLKLLKKLLFSENRQGTPKPNKAKHCCTYRYSRNITVYPVEACESSSMHQISNKTRRNNFNIIHKSCKAVRFCCFG
jgi:hypothetical protein